MISHLISTESVCRVLFSNKYCALALLTFYIHIKFSPMHPLGVFSNFILSLTSFAWGVWVYLLLLPEQMALCNGHVTPTGFLFFTVCKSCIVRHFYYSNRCPKCNIVVHQTQPLYNIR